MRHTSIRAAAKSRGPVIFALPDLVANSNGTISTTGKLTDVMSAPPGSGWYLNLHLGDSSNILKNGLPTLAFSPLLCGNIEGK